LVWGDPALFDSTIGILDDIDGVAFTYTVIPGTTKKEVMAESLFITDLLLAAGAAVSAVLLGLRAAAGGRTRWPLIVTTALVTARTVVAVLLWTESWYLVDDRVTVGLPAAVVPLVAVFTTGTRPAAARVTGQVAAIGVLISAYLAWVPQDPKSDSLIAAVVICLLSITGGTAAGLLRWRATRAGAARLPWLSGLTVLGLIAAVGGLYLQNQAPAAAATEHAGHGVAVATLTGPQQGRPDARFTLVAAHHAVRLSSGRQVDALTFNGTAPGPTLRVRQGQLVEVTLLNTDVAEGVTVHWHGVDVPNAEDGVPGLTQDPVLPGGRFVYRFVPDRAGTFWYHTHRDSQDAVSRGLFGAFIVDPPTPSADDRTYEAALFAHQWPIGQDLVGAFDTADTPTRQKVEPGRAVRLRLVNSSQDPQRIQVTGTTFHVAAIDGNAVHEPGLLPTGGVLLLAAGGRYDVTFDMPETAVSVSMHTSEKPAGAARLFVPDGHDDATIPHATVPARCSTRRTTAPRTARRRPPPPIAPTNWSWTTDSASPAARSAGPTRSTASSGRPSRT
ncbi:multicopper oxidase domain-containing protein, partial [Asanoa sp. NPDC050611]|uniref:multicopper oxidase family protein n=1 Tax=Asanoa sp. NPDC050611 TaxID=3157098 RepID=UPI0033E0DAB6